MKTQAAVVLACLALLASSSTTLQAQEKADGGALAPVGAAPASPQDLQQQIDNLKGQVEILQGRLDAFQDDTKGRLADLKDNVGTLENQVIPPLVQNLSVLTDRINELGKQSNGGLRPDILGNMERDAAYREDIRRAVQGKIVIDNQLGYEPTLFINGAPYRVRQGISHVMAPYGVVTANLRNEPTKQWNDWRFVGNEQQLAIRIGY